LTDTMKRMRFYSCFVFTLALLFLLLFPAQAEARSYFFPSVLIEAEVLGDGSMAVTEHRTTTFQGSYLGLNYWILTQQPTRIRNMSVEENGIPYDFNPGETEGPTGTFYIVEKPGRFFVDWSFEATNETRTFTLRYIVENVVMVHDDVAELYFQFVGDDWETRSDNVLVRLKLPSGVNRDDIRAWGHGPLHGDVRIHNDATITWEISPLPAYTFLEGRVTFPPSLVPNATHKTGRTALPEILAQEQALADRANRERRASVFLWLGAAFILLGSIVLAFFIWLRYGKEHTPSFDGDYFRELPANYTPAELGVLWRFGKPAAVDLTATLVDLARKGYLRLEEVTPEKRSIFGGKKQDYLVTRLKKDDNLLEHEQKLLNFLFIRASLGKEELTFDELERYTKNNQRQFFTFWQDWQATLSARGATTLDFFDHDVSTGKGIAIGLGVIMLPLGFFTANVLTPALLIGGLILIVTGLVLRRRSQRGVDDFVRWRAFRRFLLHFSEMQRHEIPSLVIWEHYLVYAITLGVAKEVIKQLQLVYPQMESGGHRFGGGWWYVHGARSPAAFSTMTDSFDSFTGQISQSLRTATSSQSSGSGRGGGFSGGGRGGGGGFGGGGGRAR